MKSKNIAHSIRNFINKPLAILKSVPAKYATYADAKDACLGYGYENEMLVDVVFQKTLNYKNELKSSGSLAALEASLQSMIGILLAELETNTNKTINVIDLGGACGAHYFYMRGALGNKKTFRWHVVETPAMVKKAKLFETDELHFFDDISIAKAAFKSDIDYFHSSGAIQYFPEPERTLKEVFSSEARFVMLSRLALSSGRREVIAVQETMLSANGPGPLPIGVQDRLCKYPVIYYPKQKLEELIHEKYSIALRFDEVITNHIEDQSIITTGYLAERLK